MADEEDELQSLASFVACQVRCLSAREENMEAEEAVEVDEENGTVTVTHPPDVHRKVKKETVLLDKVYDEAALDEEERDMGYLGELWDEIENPLLDRIELAQEACLVVLGTKQSGKSKVLFGAGDSDKPDTAEETGGAGGMAGLLPRFGRYAFEEGFSGKGGVDAIEVTMIHVGGNEHLVDLMAPPAAQSTLAGKHALRLRFSAATGTFVQGLSRAVASDMGELMAVLHEGLAARALLYHQSGRGVNTSAAHLVIELNLLEQQESTKKTKVDVKSVGVCRFVEVGDAASDVHSHALPTAAAGHSAPDGHILANDALAKMDRLHSVSLADRSLKGLAHCATLLANAADPTSLHSSVYQQCALTYLLHSPLSRGLCLWIGCVGRAAGQAKGTAAALKILDNAKSLTPTEAPPPQKQAFVLMQLDNEIKEAKEASNAARNPKVDPDGRRRVNQRLVKEAESKESALMELRQHLGSSLSSRRDRSDAAKRGRLDFIERGGLRLCHERAPPLKEMDDLKGLDASTGPFLKLLCLDGECSGRLRAMLTEGDTILGSDVEAPNVLVPSKFVKPRHCRITNDAGTLKIKPLSEDADLCINGEPVNSGLGNALSLRHGDSLLLGTGSAAENCCFEVVNWSELIEDVRTGKRKELRPSEYVPNVTEHWYFEAQRGVYTDLIEEFNKNHDLDDDDDAPRAEVEDDILQLLSLVAEANRLAAYMNRDSAFELQLKTFTFDSMTGEGVKEHDKHYGHHLEIQKPYAVPWIFVDSSNDLVPDSYWHPAKFLNRLTLIREAYDFFQEMGEDEDKFASRYPSTFDPFYDPPGHQLIGVAYLYLDPLNYLIESQEQPTIVSFKGDVVGELTIDLEPKLVSEIQDGLDDFLPVLDVAEKSLKDYNGESVLLSFHVKGCRGLPRKLSQDVFVSFRFFLENKPLSSACCAQRTQHPKWDQTLSVTQIVNDDFVHFVSNEAVELEVWGAPDTMLEEADGSGTGVGGAGYGTGHGGGLVGDHIELEVDEEDQNRGFGDDDEDGEGGDANDVDFWRRKVEALQESLDDLKREAKTNGELAVGLVKQIDAEHGAKLHAQTHGHGHGSVDSSTQENPVQAAIKLSKKHLHELEQQISELKQQRRGGGFGDGDGSPTNRGDDGKGGNGGNGGGGGGLCGALLSLFGVGGGGTNKGDGSGGGGGGDGGTKVAADGRADARAKRKANKAKIPRGGGGGGARSAAIKPFAFDDSGSEDEASFDYASAGMTRNRSRDR